MPVKAMTLHEMKRKTATPIRDNRPSAAKRGYNYRWRNANRTGAADYYLKKNPVCVDCQKENIVKQATVVDHIIPHKGDMVKFWQQSNWQSLCKQHHDIKTASEDGGFGHSLKIKGANYE